MTATISYRTSNRQSLKFKVRKMTRKLRTRLMNDLTRFIEGTGTATA